MYSGSIPVNPISAFTIFGAPRFDKFTLNGISLFFPKSVDNQITSISTHFDIDTLQVFVANELPDVSCKSIA
ncbi:MAG: hypothetical protein LBD88_01350 [Candidatus Peribacteria bacterium]|jgi:hypothetical protein|nr:hypothetical protein [Candidatus Peribacteria bacterium]